MMLMTAYSRQVSNTKNLQKKYHDCVKFTYYLLSNFFGPENCSRKYNFDKLLLQIKKVSATQFLLNNPPTEKYQ